MQVVENLLSASLSRLDFMAVVDILLVAALFFGLLRLLHGTTAMTLLRGILVIGVLAFIVSRFFKLDMFGYLLGYALTGLVVAIPVLFQPELRRALERIGRVSVVGVTNAGNSQQLIDIVCHSVERLATSHVGALIVLERETGLKEYAETGVPLDAAISVELLLTIFRHNTPLHDGAVIIRDNRVIAAGCVLPLSESTTTGIFALGTRHRAAIGVTEGTDAIAVVVSEETGRISIARLGRMVSNLDEERVRRILTGLFRGGGSGPWPFGRR
ncbi:MAG TPA: diadenylate cyclase CdaA [Dehalococcoidia bacterium]|nr:diadenylate cyclase CdaA [Dehalococcoidia bacterium]